MEPMVSDASPESPPPAPARNFRLELCRAATSDDEAGVTEIIAALGSSTEAGTKRVVAQVALLRAAYEGSVNAIRVLVLDGGADPDGKNRTSGGNRNPERGREAEGSNPTTDMIFLHGLCF